MVEPYNTTPLCPACTMTTDSDITKIITINVAITAIITNFLDPRTDPDPTCSRGSLQGFVYHYYLIS